MRIDAHHHFWRYTPQEYDWIDDAMSEIRRDFLPADLQAEINPTDITGVITVQARQTLEETDWLLTLAAEHDFIKGVVGWLPLADDDIAVVLDNYTQHKKFKSVRHVVQGEPSGFLDDPAFNRGVSQLTVRDLPYDILVLEHQLPEVIRFVDRHPNQMFVLDHIAKPKIKHNELEPWSRNIHELARRANVSCKLSGLVTESDYKHWSEPQLIPYLDTCLDAFGPSRLMFASDWPVCLVATSYCHWIHLVEEWSAPLSDNEKRAIFGDSATTWYKL